MAPGHAGSHDTVPRTALRRYEVERGSCHWACRLFRWAISGSDSSRIIPHREHRTSMLPAVRVPDKWLPPGREGRKIYMQVRGLQNVHNVEIRTLRDELSKAMDKIDRLEKAQTTDSKRLLTGRWNNQAMRGLCHSCLSSNTKISVVNGSIICAECVDADKSPEQG